MNNINSIEKKLIYAGLNSADEKNCKKLVRTAQVLMKTSTETESFIVQRLCTVNPYFAAECVSDSRLIDTYKEGILSATNNSNIELIVKLLIYYRLNAFADCSIELKNDKETLADLWKLFRSWKEFCGFVISVINYNFADQEWLLSVLTNTKISISDIYQNRNESKLLLDLLLDKKFFECTLFFYREIGIYNYFSLTNHKYEDLYMIFPNEPEGFLEQMKYCWINSIYRNENLFNIFHDRNPNLSEDIVAYYASLLYEYQVTDDQDEQFLSRCYAAQNADDIVRRVKKKTLWRTVVVENIIACTIKCMQKVRDVKRFLELFEQGNVFSMKKTMVIGVEIISDEEIIIDESYSRQLFASYTKNSKSMDSLELYKNTYLKTLFSIDDAMRIAYENVPKDAFDEYLNSNCFLAKISYMDSAEMILRLVNLSSMAYSLNRDIVLCEDHRKGDSVYVTFSYEPTDGLYVKFIGDKEEDVFKRNDYSKNANECVSIIKKIARDGYNEELLDNLRVCSEIPMLYVKFTFENILFALMKIHNNQDFMRVIIALDWNKKFRYSPASEYEPEDLKFFTQYRSLADSVLKCIYSDGLSAENLISLYMNSFFKLIFSPDELFVSYQNDPETLFEKYLFAINRVSDGKLICHSTKNFSKWKIMGFPKDSKYELLGRGLFRIVHSSDSTELSFCERQTDMYVVPKRVDRMLRAYDSISKTVDVKEYIYSFITRISREFYISNSYNCRQIAECTKKAIVIRARSYANMRECIDCLGSSNLFGSNSFPLIHHKRLSVFQANVNNEDLASSKKVSLLFMKNCDCVSNAIYLYMNTYIKTEISFPDFLNLCKECKLKEEAFSYTMYVVVKVRNDNDEISITCIDVSMNQWKYTINDFSEKVMPGKCFAVVRISYDTTYNTEITSLISAENGNVVNRTI